MSYSYKKEFSKLLFTALSLKPKKNQIVLIYDESFFKYIDSFNELVEEYILSVTYIFLPNFYQLVLQAAPFLSENEIILPNGLRSAISNSDIVLNFLSGNINTSKLRGAILSQKKTKDTRVAHCPGLSDEVLKLVLESPYKKILYQSEHLAWALGNATFIKLISTNCSGEEFILEIKFDAWEDEPIISSGTIFKDSWGNVPPGETFCCPKPHNVRGKICINGSVPGIVLDVQDEIVLTFSEGRLSDWTSTPNSKANIFLNDLAAAAEKKSDENWNFFAELGIGLNPTITRLTGNALFDEKMAGTIHIAIGDNSVFGHNIVSNMHIDMIVLRPKLIFNDRVIIDEGRLNIEEIKIWRKTFNYSSLALNDNSTIHFNSSKIKIEKGSLKRRISRGGRVSLINIISNKYSNAISILQVYLETDREVSIKQLFNKLSKKKKLELTSVLEILYHFRIIELR